VAGTVREQNRINDRLIHGSLSYVTQYLTLLRAGGGPKPRERGDPGLLPPTDGLAPTETVTIGNTQIGTGVEVTQIRQVVNTFVEHQINVSQQDLGRLQTQADGFVRLE